MKKILVPTDFSPQAEHAARFALFLAGKMNASVVLHHSYVLPVYATDLPLALPSDMDLDKTSHEGLDNLVARLKKDFPASIISTSVSDGFAEESVPRASKEADADFIVMGTRGATGLREALIGTVTGSVMEKATVPVIAVPDESEWTNFDRILYATSYEEGDFENVEEVFGFAKQLGAEVVLLHISTGKFDKTYEFDAIERFSDRMKEETGFDRISFKLLEDDDVFEGIVEYAEEIKANMIAMTLRERPFLRKLFERSTTKRVAYHTKVPLMSFHGSTSGL
ncbi:MAG: universal stress protein [Bacteroidota bacterium]